MKNYIFKNKKFIIWLTIGNLITSLLVLIVPVLMSFLKFRDNKISADNIIFYVSILMILSVGVQVLIINIREKNALKMNVENSTELYDKMFSLKYENLLKSGSSYLLDRISTFVSSIYLFLCTNLTLIITNSIITIICISIVFYYNLYLSILLTLVIPFNYFGYKKLNKTLQKKSIAMQQTSSKGYQNILAMVSNPDFIKQYSDYPYTKFYMNRELINIFKGIQDVNIYAQSMSTILRFVNIYAQNIVIFIISYDVLRDKLGITAVIIVSIILPIFFNSVNEITRTNINIHDLKSGIDFINKELSDDKFENSGEQIVDYINDIKISTTNIIKNNIKFNLEGDLHFKKGDIVYVYGASGSGKSTLLKSIASIYENEFILYNNLYLDKFNLNSLRKKILYVSQEATILPVSLQENLKVGKLSSDDSNLFVRGIDKERLSERIFEGGRNLSGGEKQRVSLARALYTEPDVMLLDEVTSNIDDNSTKLIYEDIVLSSKNKIIFITSHDESVRNICNKEIVVKR